MGLLRTLTPWTQRVAGAGLASPRQPWDRGRKAWDPDTARHLIISILGTSGTSGRSDPVADGTADTERPKQLCRALTGPQEYVTEGFHRVTRSAGREGAVGRTRVPALLSLALCASQLTEEPTPSPRSCVLPTPRSPAQQAGTHTAPRTATFPTPSRPGLLSATHRHLCPQDACPSLHGGKSPSRTGRRSPDVPASGSAGAGSTPVTPESLKRHGPSRRCPAPQG